jgi:hypothetical protein
MENVIISQANRIANGDPDIMQNIVACNFQNCNGALAKGKKLSIGEQVNFMKHRAGEYRSGIRRDFGHGRYHANEDVHCKKLYYAGEVEIHHFQYHDESENEEDVNNGKGEITSFTSVKDVEASCIFQVDFEQFLGRLSNIERNIFLMRLEGYSISEIAKDLMLDVTTIRRWLTMLGRRYVHWFGINGPERFGLA